jgi:hypothetical protein
MHKNHEDFLKWSRQNYRKTKKSNPEKHLFYAAKRRAKDNGLEFNIELSDIIIPKTCPILNTELVIGDRNSKKNSPSLDRVDSSKGYVKGNVRVISMKANAAKSNLSQEDIRRLYEYVSGLQTT